MTHRTFRAKRKPSMKTSPTHPRRLYVLHEVGAVQKDHVFLKQRQAAAHAAHLVRKFLLDHPNAEKTGSVRSRFVVVADARESLELTLESITDPDAIAVWVNDRAPCSWKNELGGKNQ